MHNGLIGEEVTLDLPCDADPSALLMGFVEELLEVGGGDADDPQRVVEELQRAVEELCDGNEDCQLEARLSITDEGIEETLSCAAAGTSERHLTVREA